MNNPSKPSPISKNPLNYKSPDSLKRQEGFAKVVAGGKVIRPNGNLPHLERMITGESIDVNKAKSKEKAVLESVASNLEAGIRIVDKQEINLAKIGGKLAEISLCLNTCKTPEIEDSKKENAQKNLNSAKSCIKELSLTTYNGTALFSNGPSKPITIAVPNRGEWEGVSINRHNLDKPGIKTVMHGKVYGPSKGFFLDSLSIKKAFKEWRNLCIENRMQWGALMDRLHGVQRKLTQLASGASWDLPPFPTDPSKGPLRRPNRNN